MYGTADRSPAGAAEPVADALGDAAREVDLDGAGLVPPEGALGLDWVGLDWVELDWLGLDGAGLGAVGLAEADKVGLAGAAGLLLLAVKRGEGVGCGSG